MSKCLNRPLLPEKVEDMVEGVVYSSMKGYNAHILTRCEDCNCGMDVILSHGKPKWTRCRDCESKRRVKYSLLPSNIEDMQEGVIYKDKWSAACILEHCKVCGNSLIIRVDQLKERNCLCHNCFNRTPEKRAIMSKTHKGIPMSEERKVQQSKSMKQHYEDHPEFRESISETSKGRVKNEETRQKISIANKGKKPSKHCMDARDKKTKEIWGDPILKEIMLDKLFKSLALKPTKPEKYLDILLQTYFVDRWAYNGDNSCNFKIDNKTPDFVSLDGFPKVIELFSYHHCPVLRKNIKPHAIAKIRTELFKKYGYDLLVIWEPELKNPEAVVEKVKEFMRAN